MRGVLVERRGSSQKTLSTFCFEAKNSPFEANLRHNTKYICCLCILYRIACGFTFTAHTNLLNAFCSMYEFLVAWPSLQFTVAAVVI